MDRSVVLITGALEAELRSLGVEAAFIRADVRREDDVSSLSTQEESNG
jgi:hypothetical protein